jgi:hypothetical protein
MKASRKSRDKGSLSGRDFLIFLAMAVSKDKVNKPAA